MAGDEGPHHVGLPARPECQAAALPRLGFDQPVDDLAALHQQLVQPRIDSIDFDTKIGQGLKAGWIAHLGRFQDMLRCLRAF